MKNDDKKLVGQIKSGNPEAERALIVHFGSRIARKVQYEIGAKNDDWKDVVNEVLLAVLENLRDGSFDPERGAALGSYIYGITRNKIFDYFKFKKKQQQQQAFYDGRDFGVADEFEMEKKELQNFMKKMLRKLKHKYQQVLYLRYYEEMSIAEISEKIGLPPRRVSERLNYAIKLLQKEMEKKNYFSIFPAYFLIII